MNELILTSNSSQETHEIGIRLGRALSAGLTIGLTGTLGAGKTTLVQGIGVGLEISSETILSPTFAICIPYQGSHLLVHLDAYRIKTAEEIDELGLDELLEEGGILIIEWYERFARCFPPLDLRISFRLQVDEQSANLQRDLQIEFLTEPTKKVRSLLIAP